MTRFVTYILLALVFLLACFMGLVLLSHVFSFSLPFIPPPQTSGIERIDTGSSFLSKLSLLPGAKRSRRPVSVIIENHAAARPQHAGFRKALLIAEFLVEGEISRFAVVYDFREFPRRVGPVRSLRPYFIDALLPEVRTILHAGGSPEALGRVEADATITTFNLLSYPDDSLRDPSIPAPHNLFLSRSVIKDLLEEEPQKTLWPPYELGAQGSGAIATSIRINFFNPEHNVSYSYGRIAGTYTRINGEIESLAHPRNLLMLEAPIAGVGEFGRLSIPLEGKGRALLFRSGIVQEGVWRKAEAEDPFRFEDSEGNPLQFASGQTWITVVPTLDRVKWE